MAEVLTLTVDTPAEDDTPLATGAGGSPAQSSPRDSEEVMSSGEEQSAAAALLGLHAAWPSSPDDEGADDDTQEATCYPYDAGADHWDTSAAAHRMMYDSGERDDYSPKNLRTVLDYDTPGNPSPKRMRAPKDGAPPPGTSRFRCKFPGCRKLYASTDAVRKHCRKRHLEWLRQIDRYSAHERGLPKPALYCVWGDDEDM